MRVAIYYMSKYGNGRKVVERLGEVINERGHSVDVKSVGEANPGKVSPADLYLFSSPTRIGKPPRKVRSFVKKFRPPAGIGKFALVATHSRPEPDKKTGKVPTAEELGKWQRTIPIMEEILTGKGMRKVGDLKVYVNGIKGPLEQGYEEKIEKFADEILARV